MWHFSLKEHLTSEDCGRQRRNPQSTISRGLVSSTIKSRRDSGHSKKITCLWIIAILWSLDAQVLRVARRAERASSLQTRRHSRDGSTQSSKSSGSRIPVNEYTQMHKSKHKQEKHQVTTVKKRVLAEKK